MNSHPLDVLFSHLEGALSTKKLLSALEMLPGYVIDDKVLGIGPFKRIEFSSAAPINVASS